MIIQHDLRFCTILSALLSLRKTGAIVYREHLDVDPRQHVLSDNFEHASCSLCASFSEYATERQVPTEGSRVQGYWLVGSPTHNKRWRLARVQVPFRHG